MAGPSPSPYQQDSRGNPLEGWMSPDGVGGEHSVFLRGPVEVAAHLKALGLGYRQLGRGHVRGTGWTDVLRAPGDLLPATATMLDALTDVLVLAPRPHMTALLALDWYKNREPDVAPSGWSNTEVGDLVYDCKYAVRADPELVQRCGLDLRDRCCAVIHRHPLYDAASTVLDVPGHDPEHLSIGSRLAVAVARKLGRPFHAVRGDGTFAPQAKNLTPEQRDELPPRTFTVDGDLSGRHVCIVDDVLRSGSTMAAAADAAWRAGARRVVGICAVRTVRGR